MAVILIAMVTIKVLRQAQLAEAGRPRL